ncbi:cation:proton antiporter [Phreatobacter stygius]|uniref:Sodium:proton antiporter n=1 Tax=Phreatobacter stygius TaxID=1940610 RepID=A0A4D7BBD4_9HYPH|nr:sodium:proton antiporter [Phreatobacter stygius]QCI67418.1 sodium:proton antiporter [Phreatobacter stygius]
MAASHILIVIIAAIALTIFADKRGIQAPLLLAAVGLAASFIPGLPRTQLEPGIILGLVLPPLLYSAAVDFSFFSFMKRIGSILNLGVALVVLTTAAAGLALGWALPALSLPAAFILGAVVAPPDAVSAVSIGRKLGLPNRLMTILKGESLVNDAAALTLFSVAVAAATGRHNFIDNATLYFLYAAGVGSAVGIVLGLVVHRIRRQLANPTLITALAIVVPFTAYALAEELHASGVMAVVFAGFTLGHNATELTFAGRIQEREVWRVIDTLLEAFVFAYMGLQLPFVIEDARASGFDLTKLSVAAGLVLAVVIVMRIAWVMLTAVLARQRHRRRMARLAGTARARAMARSLAEPLSWRENLVLSWTGMRGVVTLAAAAGTPLLTVAGQPLAGREAILPVAFTVAIATLLLQGLTLPWLIKTLAIGDAREADYVRAQMAYARKVIDEATVAVLADMREQRNPEVDIRFAAQMLRRARRAAEAHDEDLPGGGTAKMDERRDKILTIARAVLAGQRHALIAERDAERLDDEILREVLEDIDLEQAVIARRSERSAER